MANVLQLLLQLAAVLLGPALVSVWLGKVVFGPLEPHPLLPVRRTRFQLVDLMTLAVQLQVAAGVLLAALPAGELAWRAWALAIGFVLLTTWWWQGVWLLAQAQVERVGDRLWFLALVVPLGYSAASLLAILPLVLAIIVALTLAGEGVPQRYVVALLLLGAMLLHVGILFGCRCMCQLLRGRGAG